jgi:hypothetical protein
MRGRNSQVLSFISSLNVFGAKPAGLKILAVVPSILGSNGVAVNERQFEGVV